MQHLFTSTSKQTPSDTWNSRSGSDYNAKLDVQWPDGVIPFVLDNGFSFKDKCMILKSMKLLNDKTCVKFVPRLQHQHQNYVYITKTPDYHPQNGYYTEEFPPWVIQRRIENEWGTPGCWSYLGNRQTCEQCLTML